MNTWEMIKELTENPYKEYISKEATARRAYVKRGVLFIVIDETGKAVLDTDLNREWEEVKKSVTFMEAVKSEKKVKVEHEIIISADGLSDRYNSLKNVMNILSQYFVDKGIRDVLENGKWYIED